MEQQKNTQTKERLEFRGGWAMAFLPVAIFLFFCILYFVVFKAFEMYALAMGAFVGLLVVKRPVPGKCTSAEPPHCSCTIGSSSLLLSPKKFLKVKNSCSFTNCFINLIFRNFTKFKSECHVIIYCHMCCLSQILT